jgi:glycerol-3-phosphate cytidylyltransferase
LKKIGYATGVFDLFHVGHLNVLRRAKQECDILIVGVSTDELVLSLKNRTPVIPFEERLDIVANIKCVDHAVAEHTVDKMAAWKELQFHVTFKGDDWKGSEKWNKLEADFSEVGVQVIFFPYTAHTSSTKLRNALDLLEQG